ncbi:hypothetical protein BO70DRAFT_365660 [Aspergillus heteromorphus CBS 117.55]|uniref:Uncharacterized protein n=1 Tax=Aspergillus heteromorphus CBS 117.55 TaxID=1448321 RepID=A0A317VCY2_9EURO|nr:uncharacterized protein BO70DRAFT_365660 [Aspergillus heteromorphus CBS 117.55]PWY69730.1 hypothetical protein BO70DRAFT_365660 [Aspergillus heteromorphus CBS 117.55]
MSFLLDFLGLHATPTGPPPNHAIAYLIGNWFLAHGVLSTRPAKRLFGLDHNVAPREDLSKYGEAAVQAGKITRSQLNRLKRQEAAHANTIEGFPLFVAAVLVSLFAGLPSETINGIGLWYTVSRVAFGVAYVGIESEGWSFLRSLLWWSGNVSCITALVLGGKNL